MKTYISLLRGINVGGHKKILMADLRAMYESLGLRNVQSYLQSGNVVFESVDEQENVLAGRIESAIEAKYDFKVRILLRCADDLRRLLKNNPFLSGRDEDPAKLCVVFLENSISGLPELPQGIGDECVAMGKELFVFCPNGFGRTKLTNGYFEKKLAMAATTRNWKTVNALFKMSRE